MPAVLLLGGFMCLAAALAFLRGDGEVVREVAGVRHSDEIGVPQGVSPKGVSPKGVSPQGASPREAPGERWEASRDADEVRAMVASYYGYSLEGEPTASGEPFDPEGYTAAHKRLPLGTELSVSYGGESVRVVVNDRGPYVGGRDLDLSLAAAREVGLTEIGAAPRRVVAP